MPTHSFSGSEKPFFERFDCLDPVIVLRLLGDPTFLISTIIILTFPYSHLSLNVVSYFLCSILAIPGIPCEKNDSVGKTLVTALTILTFMICLSNLLKIILL